MKRRQKRKSKRKPLKIIYSNARGIRSKLTSLKAIIEKQTPDLIIIVESHLVRNNTIKIKGYDRITYKNRTSNGGGILIAAKNNQNIEMVTIKIHEEMEQLWVQLMVNNFKFNLAAAYGPVESRTSTSDINNWYYELEKSYAENDSNPTIILGDFNAHIGNDREGIIGNNDKIDSGGEALRNLIKRRKLILGNSSEKCQGKITRMDPKGNHSIIDYVITNPEMFDKIQQINIDEERLWTLTNYTKKRGKPVEIPSDHNTIIITLNCYKTVKTIKQTIWDLKNEKSMAAFKEETENQLIKEKWDSEGDPTQKYKRWNKQLQSSLYKCFQKITITNKNRSQKSTELVNQKRKIKEYLNKLSKEGLNNGIVATLLRTELNTKVEEITNQIKKETSERINNNMEDIVTGKKKADEIWSVRKRATKASEQVMAIKNQEGNILTGSTEIKERYKSYYRELLEPRDPFPEAKETEDEITKLFNLHLRETKFDSEPINQPFTETEINKVIKELKPNKSPGEDQITNELIKNFGKNLKMSLLSMMNWIFQNEKLPEQLLKINIKSIYKGKGSTAELKNHRGIFIGNAILKILESLIHNRAAPVTEKSGFTESQIGGRKSRGIYDHIFTLRSIMEEYKYIKSPIILEFIDLVKAFDKMILKNVLNDLWKAEVKGKIWRNIYMINQTAFIKVKTPAGLTEEFQIGETLKQGSVLASTLASLHTDGVSRLFENSGIGINYGKLRINQLLFQDDILKIESSPHNLNQANSIYSWFANVNRMVYHQDKSVYMTTSNEKADIQLSNMKLQSAEKYKYLADYITPSGSLDETIKQRSFQIQGITAELNTIINLIDDQGIHIQASIKYHQAINIPKLLTNSETWANITANNLSSLEDAQNQNLKRLLRLPQGTPTLGMINELGMWTIQTTINYKKLLYLHKLIHYPDTYIAKQVLLTQMEKPGPTWWRSILQIGEQIGQEINQEKIAKMSKFQWKNEIKQKLQAHHVKNLQEWVKNSKKCKKMKPQGKLQEYIKILGKDQARALLLERLGMTKVKANYKNMYQSTLCDKCHCEEETTIHLIRCQLDEAPAFKETVKNFENILWNIESQSPQKIKEIGGLLSFAQKYIASKTDAAPPSTGEF